MTTSAGPAQQLATRWRGEAEILRRRGAAIQADLLEGCAEELLAAASEWDARVLSLDEAAAESGYSLEHLGRLLRQGRLPNAGRKHAPRIRRQDLPSRVTPPRDARYDPRTDARNLLTRRNGL